MSFGSGIFEDESVKTAKDFDWQRLMLAASILAESEDTSELETALMIAQAGLVFGSTALVRDASAVVLSQLSNRQAVRLAEKKDLVRPDLTRHLGLTQRLLATRRAIEDAIPVNSTEDVLGNPFQQKLWDGLGRFSWLSATAPTAAGKTYLILNWLMGELQAGRGRLAVFLAPTRALVTEIERELLDLKPSFLIPDLRVASLPLRSFGDGLHPTILVFTQERLHLFLNGFEQPPEIDLCIVDEAQKVSDGGRGVILQDAVERILRTKPSSRFVFLSPHSCNPEVLLLDAPQETSKDVVAGRVPTVTQNLFVARSKRRKTQDWELFLVSDQGESRVGEFHLHDRPAGQTQTKRLSFIALALGRAEPGTLVYANRASDAEKIASQIYDGLAEFEPQNGELDEDLADLIDYCRTRIHPKFQLVHLLRRGVGFHYGNMPSILRRELERLFRIGKIRFLVCTSTLVEGVNLACRTIIVRGPKKGTGKDSHMTPQDFWNLAGRAGRWGSDFYGNIVCVDPDEERLWPSGIPQKEVYPIIRETDRALQDIDGIANYIEQRASGSVDSGDEAREHIAAYLLSHFARQGDLSGLSSIRQLDPDSAQIVTTSVAEAFAKIELPEELLTAHPGISAIAMQALLNDFRSEPEDIEELLPPLPEDSNAAQYLKPVFQRINRTLAPVFPSEGLQWAAAFTTIDWMRGKRIGEMIAAAIQREQSKDGDKEINFATIIRNTMKFVEEFARFAAPKYLSAYLDVLRFRYTELGRASEFPADLPFDLYLEFGVNTNTMLSFIGLGLSRTSAIELADFLARDDLTEAQAVEVLREGTWETLDIPRLVKREIREVITRFQNAS
ncbi:DEAD/DEAH box helicase [Hyphomonas sp.]|uniref:DEAD/DEAH box helicase n=1 Tax=Hyphomonas sp. TaxID=87 RepID=UPI0035294DD0